MSAKLVLEGLATMIEIVPTEVVAASALTDKNITTNKDTGINFFLCMTFPKSVVRNFQGFFTLEKLRCLQRDPK